MSLDYIHLFNLSNYKPYSYYQKKVNLIFMQTFFGPKKYDIPLFKILHWLPYYYFRCDFFYLILI